MATWGSFIPQLICYIVSHPGLSFTRVGFLMNQSVNKYSESFIWRFQMEHLIEVLQGIIEKYQIEQQDVALIQEAIDAAQGATAEEFTYEQEQM